MREAYLKRFAVVLSLLLLLQESHALIESKILDDGVPEIIPETKTSSLQSLDKDQQREKRFIFTTILIVTTVISIGAEIYKQARGCKDFTPDLEPTANKGKRLEAEIKKLQADVESAWKPVQTLQSYADKLDKNLVKIREKINTYKILIKEILHILDRKALDEMNRVLRTLENDIDRGKEESVGSMEDFQAMVGSPLSFALSMTAKTVTLGVAAHSLIAKSSAKVATETGATWAAKNPGRVSSMISKFAQAKGSVARWSASKIASFKSVLSAKFAGNIGLKLAKFKSVFAKLGKTTIGKALGKAMSVTGKALVKTGAAIAAVILFAYDVWQFVKFAQECHKKLREAREAVRTMEQSRIELTTIRLRITILAIQVTTAYNQMKASISSNDFKDFLREVIELGEGAQVQTTDIKWAVNTLKVYIQYISYNNLYLTNWLNGYLLQAFDKINYKLGCLKSKLNIRMSVVNNCEDGVDSFINLYNQAKNLERQTVTNDCIAGQYMSESEIRGMVQVAMEERGAQQICIRNNDDKKKMACNNLQNQQSNSQNANSLGVSVADIVYFITQCETKDLKRTQQLSICSKKSEGNTIAQVKGSFHSYYHSQVQKVYDDCDLADSQKISVCSLKENGYDINHVQNKYNLYPSLKVQAVYDGCQKRNYLTPNEENQICVFQAAGMSPTNPLYAGFWKLFYTKVEKSVVDNRYNQPCP